MALSSYLVFKTARVAHVRAPGLALLRYVMMLVLMFYIGKAAKRQIGLKHRDRASSRAHCARCTYMERLASHPNTSELRVLFLCSVASSSLPPHDTEPFASLRFHLTTSPQYCFRSSTRRDTRRTRTSPGPSASRSKEPRWIRFVWVARNGRCVYVRGSTAAAHYPISVSTVSVFLICSLTLNPFLPPSDSTGRYLTQIV